MPKNGTPSRPSTVGPDRRPDRRDDRERLPRQSRRRRVGGRGVTHRLGAEVLDRPARDARPPVRTREARLRAHLGARRRRIGAHDAGDGDGGAGHPEARGRGLHAARRSTPSRSFPAPIADGEARARAPPRRAASHPRAHPPPSSPHEQGLYDVAPWTSVGSASGRSSTHRPRAWSPTSRPSSSRWATGRCGSRRPWAATRSCSRPCCSARRRAGAGHGDRQHLGARRGHDVVRIEDARGGASGSLRARARREPRTDGREHPRWRPTARR